MANEVRAAIPALYVDNIRAWDPVDVVVLINCIPEDGETHVPRQPQIQLQVVSTGPIALEQDVQVIFTRGTTGTVETAVDMNLGGVQAGYTGTAVSRQSVGSAILDEFVASVVPDVAFASTETIGVTVRAHLMGQPFSFYQYSFQIVDYASPTITGIIWLSPKRALVQFDEVLDTDSLYYLYVKGGVEICPSGHIYLRGSSVEGTVIGAGMRIEVRGADWSINNLSDEVVAAASVPTSGESDVGYLDITTSVGGTIADTGKDYDTQGVLVDTREIRCGINRIQLEARLSDEGTSPGDPEAEKIQTAYIPIVKSITLVESEDLPGGVESTRWVYVDFDEPLSLGRLYRLSWMCGDLLDNWGTTTIDFRLPRFQVAEGIDFWTTGILSGKDKEQDIQDGDGNLRQLTAIMSDGLLLLRYYAQVMDTLNDPYKCPDEWVPFLLYNRGNPFRYALRTTRLGRRTAEFLPDLLRKKGTAEAIEEFIWNVFGVHSEVIVYWTATHWILGSTTYGRLGHTTILGPGTAYEKNCWVLVTSRDLTDEEEEMITEVCVWSDPMNLHFLGVIEPSDITGGTVIPGGGYWILGTSALGSGTILAP